MAFRRTFRTCLKIGHKNAKSHSTEVVLEGILWRFRNSTSRLANKSISGRKGEHRELGRIVYFPACLPLFARVNAWLHGCLPASHPTCLPTCPLDCLSARLPTLARDIHTQTAITAMRTNRHGSPSSISIHAHKASKEGILIIPHLRLPYIQPNFKPQANFLTRNHLLHLPITTTTAITITSRKPRRTFHVRITSKM